MIKLKFGPQQHTPPVVSQQCNTYRVKIKEYITYNVHIDGTNKTCSNLNTIYNDDRWILKQNY